MLEHRREAHSDERVGARVLEARLYPPLDRGVQLDFWKRPDSTHVVVHRDHDAPGTKVGGMVSQNVDRVRQVHEQQPAHDGVEGLVIDERARITLAEDDVAGIEVSPPVHSGGFRSVRRAADLQASPTGASAAAEVEHPATRHRRGDDGEQSLRVKTRGQRRRPRRSIRER